MKTLFKKLTAILLCLAMLLAFAGCGDNVTTSDAGDASEDLTGEVLDFEDETVNLTGGDGSSTTSGGSTSSGDTIVSAGGGGTVEKPVELTGDDPFANIPKRLKGTTVTFAQWGDEGAEDYKKVYKAFEKKTGIKVKIVSFNEGEYVSQIAKQINGGAAPDIVVCNDTFPSFIEVVQPLNNILNLKDSFWDPTVTAFSTVGSNTYFVNSYKSVWSDLHLGVYNKKIFTDFGIKTPTEYWNEGKWTYENLKFCIDQVKQTGNIGGYLNPEKMTASLGSPVIGYDSKTQKFVNNAASAVAAYQLTSQIFKEGGWNSTSWWGVFANGNIGLMSEGGIYGIKYNGFYKDINPSDLACFPTPISYQGKAAKATRDVRGYGIAKGAKNPEGAAYFLRFFLDYDYYKEAGVNIFMNKTVEKTYFDVIVPDAQKRGVVYDVTGGILTYANADDPLLKAERAEAGQVSGIISSQNNVIQNAVNKANEKLNSYK